MSIVAHDQFATASWQGNFDSYSVGPGNDTKMISISLEAGTSDLDLNDLFKFIRLSADTVVLGGWFVTDSLDSGTPLLKIDVGFDSVDDDDTDDPNFFYDGSAAAAASYNVNFIAGLGCAAAPFIPTGPYMVQAVVTAAADTAVAGTLTLHLLLGHAEDYT